MVEEHIAYGVVQTPVATDPGPEVALDRAGGRRAADGPPEPGEMLARALGTTGLQAVGHHYRVHRPGTRAADALDPQSRFLKQAIEHAPGKRTVRATTLQSQLDRLGCCAHALLSDKL